MPNKQTTRAAKAVLITIAVYGIVLALLTVLAKEITLNNLLISAGIALAVSFLVSMVRRYRTRRAISE